jgi:hypothetical protein
MEFIIFTLRNERGWWCNIEGAETGGPVVYRVPLSFYRQHVSQQKPAGITTHGHADYTGPCHAINVCHRSGGVVTLHTGACK